tara:strand:+ start:2302 stop:5385 length:3084 start_codon:yes stop_codon:yes gene_type:complete
MADLSMLTNQPQASLLPQEEGIIEPEVMEETQEQPLSSRKARRESLPDRLAASEAADVAADQAYTDKRLKEVGYTLTLDDIYDSPTLQKLGVQSGDRFKDGKLVRIHSKDEDEIDIDRVLTQEDIDGSPTLQNTGAVVGDLIINKDGEKTFLSRGKANQSRQAVHKFIRDGNYLSNATAFMEALAPIPKYAMAYSAPIGYTGGSPEDLITVEDQYGEDISKLPFNERRLAVKRRKERMLQRLSGPMFTFDPESTGATVGAIAKAVIDPINLAPAASTVKGGIMLGTAIAGFGSALDDVVSSESGEIDVTKAVISAGAGAVLSGALLGGVKVIADRGAKKLVRNAQIEIDKGIRAGMNPYDPEAILKKAGMDTAAVGAAQKRLNVKVNISPQKVADKQLEETIVNDSAVGRFTNSKVDKVLGVLSTRIKAISEPVFGRIRKFELDTNLRTQQVMQDAEGFVRGLSQLPEAQRSTVARLLYNEDFDAARELMGRGLADEFDMSVLPMLSKLGDDLLESGHSFQKIDNYFPRLVKDLKGLQESLGVEQKGMIGKAQRQYAAQKKISVDMITDAENAEIIDKLVRGYSFAPKDGKPAFVRNRKLTLSDDQMKYYASPEESLSIYLRRAVNDLEKRKFLGKYKTNNSETGLVDMDNSIGDYVAAETKAGRIRQEDEVELIEMLKSRFVGGEQSPNSVNATIRDLGYMGTIANPISALTQLGDLGTSGALHGFRNTIGSLFGSKNWTLVDLAVNEVSKELSQAGARGTAKVLDNLMGKAGFKYMDRLGKETIINAAYKNASKLAKTPKGREKLLKKFGKTYGDETKALLKDLEEGNRSGTVKQFLFNELSDAQPISLSEFPQTYLDNPNGRILYMLKSFTLKQIDIVRRNVVQEYAKGNKKEAIKNATLLAGYLSVANTGTQMAKDLVLGREVKAEDIPDRAMWSLLGVYGMNQYTVDKYWSNGDWKGAVFNQIAPATPIIDAALTLGGEVFEDDPDMSKVVRSVPVVGPLAYNWLLGGAENYNERREARRSE